MTDWAKFGALVPLYSYPKENIMSGFSPVPGDGFTDEMLAKNFVAIASGFQDMERWVSHLEGHVTELYQAAKAASEVKIKTPSRVKPFLIGAAVGIVLYRYSKNNRAQIEQIKKEAKEQVESFINAQKSDPSEKPDPSV
jgi:hypothetical protein